MALHNEQKLRQNRLAKLLKVNTNIFILPMLVYTSLVTFNGEDEKVFAKKQRTLS